MQLMALPHSKDPADATARVRSILQHVREIVVRDPKRMLELLDFVDQILEGIGSTVEHVMKTFGGLVSPAAANA